MLLQAGVFQENEDAKNNVERPESAAIESHMDVEFAGFEEQLNTLEELIIRFTRATAQRRALHHFKPPRRGGVRRLLPPHGRAASVSRCS